MVNTPARNLFDLMQLYRSEMKSAVGTKESKLNAMHIQCMRFIQETDQCTARAIELGLYKDKSQISLVIRDMAKKGWVEFQPNPNDKRSKLIQTTDIGDSLLASVAMNETLLGEQMRQGLTDEDIERFNRIVLIMKHNLKRK